jgi:hypothetical protein
MPVNINQVLLHVIIFYVPYLVYIFSVETIKNFFYSSHQLNSCSANERIATQQVMPQRTKAGIKKIILSPTHMFFLSLF